MKRNHVVFTRVPLYMILTLISLKVINCSQEENSTYSSKHVSDMFPKLTIETASQFAGLALRCIHREYPNKLSHVMNDAGEVRSPKELHPAFYGCFDWHSSVHGHWMLVRLLKRFPGLPEAEKIRNALNINLSQGNILREVAYLHQPSRKSFERMYGWAWLLKLAEELHNWEDVDGRRWLGNLEPLVEEIVKRYLGFLPKQTYPIRTGVHPNTAFGIAFGLDYARTTGHRELEYLLQERSLSYYRNDHSYPASWEPGGEDFFSASLLEADLMRRVLKEDDFLVWFNRFLPDLKAELKTVLQPALVSDRSDPKIVHLDGLNLSRAWCMVGIASAFSSDSDVHHILIQSALKHAEQALGHVASGEYEGEHWLATFAVYMLSVMEWHTDK
ncbi:DUF2891 domain-containing protein [bacterium]